MVNIEHAEVEYHETVKTNGLDLYLTTREGL